MPVQVFFIGQVPVQVARTHHCHLSSSTDVKAEHFNRTWKLFTKKLRIFCRAGRPGFICEDGGCIERGEVITITMTMKLIMNVDDLEYGDDCCQRLFH